MKISIIVPVYNVKDYLKKSLDSLVNQSFDNYEIILVDDGSNDGSTVILNEYKEKYSDKVFIYSQSNSGQAVARNLGIEKANGDYLMFVDSDDYIAKDTLKIAYAKVQETGAEIVCFGAYKVIDDEVFKDTDNIIMGSNDVETYILNQIGPCFKLIKTSLIKENKLYFPRLRAYEDIAVVPAYGIFTDKIIFLEESFYYYLMRTGSTMKQEVYSSKLEHIFPALSNLTKIFKANGMFDKYYKELEFLFIQHLIHGAGLRFITFDNYEDNLNHIVMEINNIFPNWRKNYYYKKKSLKYRMVCELLFRKNIKLLKILKKG